MKSILRLNLHNGLVFLSLSDVTNILDINLRGASTSLILTLKTAFCVDTAWTAQVEDSMDVEGQTKA